MTDSTSGRVIHELLRGLTDFDENSQVVPSLAKSWTISEDELTYTFTLRDNIKWSDGKPITTADFLYSWERILTQKNASQYASFLFSIKNAEDFYNTKINDFSQVGIKVLDDTHLEVILRKPNGFFLSMIGFQVAFPVRQDNVEKYGNQFTEAGQYITSGPFRLAKWQHDTRITLEPNPYYWDGEADKRPTVKFEMIPDQNTATTLFEQGVLDMADSGTVISDSEYARYLKDPRTKTVGISYIQYLGFNTKIAPFDDASIRKAFCQCMNRDYFPILLKSGQKPLKTFVTENLFGYNAKYGHNYAPQEAKAAWEAYLKKNPNVEIPPLLFPNKYDTRKMGEILKFQWQEALGIHVPLRSLDWKVFLSRMHYDTPPMYLLTWFVDYPDADSFLSLFHHTNGNNHTGWQDDEYEALLEKGAALQNGSERQKAYDRAQEILVERDTVVCPMFSTDKLWVTQPWVEGLSFSAMNDISMDDVRIKQKP